MPQNLTPALPWQERWTEPTLEGLLAPIDPQHRQVFEALMAELEKYEDVSYSFKWYGPSWNWTLEYAFVDAKGKTIETLGYLVPRIELPVVCVILTDAQIDGLPIRRLNRMIREGIRSAQCAVQVHWCKWTPHNHSEIGHLVDLIKRKRKMVTGK